MLYLFNLQSSVSTIILKKDIVRKTYLERRKKLSSSKFEEESSQLVQNTIELIKKYKPKCIHCFLPIHSKGEINTTPIIHYCWKNKINVVVPVSNFAEGTLKTAEFSPYTKTKKTKNNITEPIDPIWKKNDHIDIVFTPLLAFDPQGNRVGYGKGFYDRFFSSLHKDAKRIGISLFKPCTDIENINEYDVPLTHCVTPDKTYFF
jgi:5-formyltetrahydrofolate cyclo-ligase